QLTPGDGELAKESRMREIRTYGLTRGPRAKALVLLYYIAIVQRQSVRKEEIAENKAGVAWETYY
ncbi:hypothetical protein, partial [Peribacillus cavernae]|uniref:hypothetical protein n=1 Tax=Peribacillus cavernae TaxID=1674310 RepID=UPI00277F398C